MDRQVYTRGLRNFFRQSQLLAHFHGYHDRYDFHGNHIFVFRIRHRLQSLRQQDHDTYKQRAIAVNLTLQKSDVPQAVCSLIAAYDSQPTSSTIVVLEKSGGSCASFEWVDETADWLDETIARVWIADCEGDVVQYCRHKGKRELAYYSGIGVWAQSNHAWLRGISHRH